MLIIDLKYPTKLMPLIIQMQNQIYLCLLIFFYFSFMILGKCGLKEEILRENKIIMSCNHVLESYQV